VFLPGISLAMHYVSAVHYRSNQDFRSKYKTELRASTNCQECDVRINAIAAGSVVIDTSLLYPASGPPPDAREVSEVAQDLARSPARLFSAMFLGEFGFPETVTSISAGESATGTKGDREVGGIPEPEEGNGGQVITDLPREGGYTDNDTDVGRDDADDFTYDDDYDEFFAFKPVEEVETSKLNHPQPTEGMVQMDGSIASITLPSGALLSGSPLHFSRYIIAEPSFAHACCALVANI